MARTVLGTPMGQMMYSDALLRMAGGGQLLPHEQDILTLAPLPESFISPFASQESGLLDTLRTTAKALDTWDEEIKKVDYFTKHFTDLSKMVLKGVTTMGRGLMSLHNMGEDLSLSPKSIQDLIMIASYHFRKSYIGVMQTVKKYPEVSTRLLVNQLDWANMIFRLNATKVKLSKPIVGVEEAASSQLPAASVVDGCQLPVDSGKDAASSQLPAASEADGCPEPLESGSNGAVRGMSALDPISGPSAIGASRAFSPLNGKGFSGSRLPVGKKAVSGQPSAASDKAEVSKEDKASTDYAEFEGNQKAIDHGMSESYKKETVETEKDKESDQLIPDDKEIINKTRKINKANTPESSIQENETDGVRPCCLNTETTGSDPTVSQPGNIDPLEQAFTNEKPHEPKPEPPSYADIVMAAVERSKGNSEGIRFKLTEVRQLLANPEFRRDEPEMAAQFQAFLRAGP